MKKSPVFKETAQYYLRQLERLPLEALASRLGLEEVRDGKGAIRILGRLFHLEPGRAFFMDLPDPREVRC